MGRRSLAAMQSGMGIWPVGQNPLLGILVTASALSVIFSPEISAQTVPTFSRVTSVAGLADPYASSGVYGPGVAAVDYDGDGDLDLFVSNDLSGNKLYRNEGDGTFVDRAAELGLAFVAEKPPLEDQTHPAEAEVTNMMPVFLDTDNDGDRDFFLTVWNGYCRFFENNGDGTFTDRTHESGLAIVGHSATAAFADYNRDGLLDVYIADWGGPDHLFRNDGGNRWSDVSSRAGLYDVVADPQPGWCAIWFDHNDDYWPDLYVGNDFGQPNFFYINNSGYLEDRARTHFPELNDPDRTIFQNNATMGQTLGDFDRDGDYDLFVANSLLNDLYRRVGDVYIDLIESPDPALIDLRVAMKNNDIGWFCDWSDLNNDGWVDLFMVNGFIRLCFYDDPNHPDCSGLGEREQPNLLWINDRNGSFLRVVDQAGLSDLGWARSGALADFDHDGDVDVFVANTGYAERPATHGYWRNDTADLGNWLVVRLRGVRSNREAIGAQVRARVGEVVHMRDRFAASG